MTFAGIDYDSNRIDVVTLALDDDTAIWGRFRLDTRRGDDAFARCRRVRDVLPSRGHWRDSGIVLVAVEEPVGEMRGASPLYRVQGAILACLPPELEVWRLKPHEWRQAIGLPAGGKRDALKSQAAVFAHEHGVDPTARWPNDATDAFCIAYAARTLCDREAEREAATMR